jgi:hypothetical protein
MENTMLDGIRVRAEAMHADSITEDVVQPGRARGQRATRS